LARQQTLNNKPSNNGGNLGFEAKMWTAADKLRNNMDAAEYKHVVLGLIFLKYISDAFIELYEELKHDPEGDPEEKDYYLAKNIFWVPKDARWEMLQKNAKQPTIGVTVDNAMDAIERENASLRGVLPKNYGRDGLDKQRLGELIDLISTIALGDKESRSKDILGRVYEYFLGQFADAEGKKGGQFYTPRSIVQLLVAMIEPFKGKVYDPCCGSGGMFIQSEKSVQAHQGRIDDIFIFGQESNQTTWRLCKMNLAIRGIESKEVRWNNEGSFLNDTHKDLRADFLLANPPFNDSDWKGEMLREDIRWKYGVPPTGNANYAWVQHFIHHLAPYGTAGFVLANGSMSSNTSNEGEIRKNIIEADLIDCMVSLPSQLFYNTPIPACLWFIVKDKQNNKFRDRKGETLFIDARNLGNLVDRRHRELIPEDIKKISDTYHAWRGEPIDGKKKAYQDIAGFCKAVKLEEIKKQGQILTPGRYVGAEEEEDNDEIFDEKIKQLTEELSKLIIDETELNGRIKEGLGRIGYVF
jgi:type I restriction enzyme M protein